MDVHPTKNGINRYWPIPIWYSTSNLGSWNSHKEYVSCIFEVACDICMCVYVQQKCLCILSERGREREGGKKNEGELMYGHIYIMFKCYNIYVVHHVYIYICSICSICSISISMSMSMSIYIYILYAHTHTLTQLFHMFPQLYKLGPRAYRPHRLHPQEWPQPCPMKSVKVSLDQNDKLIIS